MRNEVPPKAYRNLALAFVFTAVCFPMAVCGQTVRPLIAELGNPSKGRVEYVNDSLTPLNVVLTAKSFTVSETGEISYRPLDANIHLKLSNISFRIQPQQSFFVFYEANTENAPAWFVIYAAFSGFPFRTQQGMNVRLELPHTVYLLPKQSVDKSEVRIARAEYLADSKSLRLEVENTGDYFGRVQQTFLVSKKKKQEAPGFPLFPHSRRILEVPVDGTDAPESFILDFQNFKIENQVSTGSP